MTSTTTSTLDVTTTVTNYVTTCIGGTANAINLVDPLEPLLDYNSTVGCPLGLTLGVASSPGTTVGTNETMTLTLTNDETVARNVNTTGSPTLPNDFNIASNRGWNSILPDLSNFPPSFACDLQISYVPIFIAIYNSDMPLLLTHSIPNAVVCGSTSSGRPPSYYSFGEMQTVSESLSVGGYWTSSDTNQPWPNATYHQFPLGNYTIVAFDLWGQFVELNFSVSNPPASQTHQVTFQQLPCGGDYAVPWSVTLGGSTITMPVNATIPPGGSAELQNDPAAATIVFTVLPGTYSYTVLPTDGFTNTVNTTDSVTVTNASVVVQIEASCHPSANVATE